jgi:hypothetical protein
VTSSSRPIFAVVYVSTAVAPFGDEELKKLLTESRISNCKVGITGLLLYREGNFMQFLEGPKDAVLETLARIKTDPRHHSMIFLTQQAQERREFASWSMGFERLDLYNTPAPDGFTDLWELPFSCDEFLTNPTRTLQFLLTFKETVS